MNQRKSGTFQLPFLLFAVIALAVAAIACGGSGDGEVSESEGPIAKIDDTDRIYTADDIKNATNFKLDDDYDIEGLDDAIAAIYGFYGADPYSRLEYEVRFYADHATAMSTGAVSYTHLTLPTILLV